MAAEHDAHSTLHAPEPRSLAAFPWRRVTGFGLGVLGWPPETFWKATIMELKAAADGRRSAAGGGDILEEADIEALRVLLRGDLG